MRFRDRTDAGQKLAQALGKYRRQDGIVYPLPRGGVVLGVEIARALDLPLDLIIPRKIGHPYNPEYAICAVTEHGPPICNEEEIARVDPAWFRRRVEAERREARRRRELYLADREPPPVEGKVAILVDDGIATGLTMRAAIHDTRRHKPARIVVAIPVAPKDTTERLAREVDEVVALDVSDFYLGAVGAYYDDFPQLTDDEVVRLLKSARGPRADSATPA
jgi:predicted phosphoribosyltransferase